ncbi:NAD(P)-dependent oxidoreductase [Aureimonas mangrovi]|uniref:NAD(P)-dependent oxidoreductase n=1 Tax=Aureimonas mangrovi TaxID=2758041 RepID=UPI001AEDA022|nr:NAD(P)-dependent oxidoreductase [Aureimonas mangrovi]
MTARPVVLMVPKLPRRIVEKLEASYEVLGPLPASRVEDLPAGAERAVALLTMGTMRTDAAFIDALPALEMIALYGTGHEGVDGAHARSKGIRIANAGAANAISVAEFAVGSILASTRQLASGDRFVREGRWQGNSVERMPMVPGLYGRRVGIYGLGSVGRLAAPRLEAFGCEIGYHNRNRVADVPYAYFDGLAALAEWCDVLLVAVRASAENRHAVNADILRALGPSGTLVNISRGIAVDTEALCDALEAQAIAGAALDVFETEPDVPMRLRALDNVVLTPHVAANTRLAQEAQQDRMLDNLSSFFAGGRMPGEL